MFRPLLALLVTTAVVTGCTTSAHPSVPTTTSAVVASSPLPVPTKSSFTPTAQGLATQAWLRSVPLSTISDSLGRVTQALGAGDPVELMLWCQYIQGNAETFSLLLPSPDPKLTSLLKDGMRWLHAAGAACAANPSDPSAMNGPLGNASADLGNVAARTALVTQGVSVAAMPAPPPAPPLPAFQGPIVTEGQSCLVSGDPVLALARDQKVDTCESGVWTRLPGNPSVTAPATQPAATPVPTANPLNDAAVGAVTTDSAGVLHIAINVTNHGPSRADYLITVALESGDHLTQFETSIATVTSLDPGQSGQGDAMFFGPHINDIGAKGVIKSVTRS